MVIEAFYPRVLACKLQEYCAAPWPSRQLQRSPNTAAPWLSWYLRGPQPRFRTPRAQSVGYHIAYAGNIALLLSFTRSGLRRFVLGLGLMIIDGFFLKSGFGTGCFSSFCFPSFCFVFGSTFSPCLYFCLASTFLLLLSTILCIDRTISMLQSPHLLWLGVFSDELSPLMSYLRWWVVYFECLSKLLCRTCLPSAVDQRQDSDEVWYWISVPLATVVSEKIESSDKTLGRHQVSVSLCSAMTMEGDGMNISDRRCQ